ncbi:MAG: LysM peptidoglycan-binding domain-containing protein [Acidiferrobacterales bacterium]
MKNLENLWKACLLGVAIAIASGCATAPEEEAEPAAPEAAPEALEPAKPGEMELGAEPMKPARPGEMDMSEVQERMVITDEGLTQYTVVRGDNLWDIASYRVIYGNPYQWPLIYKANTDQIADADLIEPDQVLIIPRDSSASDIEMAIQHARTRGAWSLGVVEQSDREFLQRAM